MTVLKCLQLFNGKILKKWN